MTDNQRAGRRTRRRLRTAALSLATIAGPLTMVAPTPAAAEDLVIYDDAIRDGWTADYSWGSVDLDGTDVVRSGSAAVEASLDAWAGAYLATDGDTEQPVPFFGDLVFDLNGGANVDAEIIVQLTAPDGAPGPRVSVIAPTDAWETFAIPLQDLGGFSSIGGVWWQEGTGADIAPIHIDNVQIVGGEAPPAEAGIVITIDAGQRTITRSVVDPHTNESSDHTISFPHEISDDIYGMNFAPDSIREEFDVPVNRWGGNSTERYNHETSSSNAGLDWFFATVEESESADDVFESENEADGTATLMTIGATGWVSSGGAATCGFPIEDDLGPGSGYGTQDAEIDHWLDESVQCGNGFSNGENVGPSDPTLTSIAVDSSWATSWVEELVATHGDAASGGVEIYAIGNEPGLWSNTHRDIRPDPITRAELIANNADYAAAIKEGDPTAEVVGPVSWSGWSYYVTPDEMFSGQYGGVLPTLLGDYLAGMSDASDEAGTRLLDRLAINFYDDRVYGGGSDALRLESTRQLWDPTYTPDWWVVNDLLNGNGSAVIPRMNTLIDANYPGTGLAITEYNFGGEDTVAGGLAQVDALGIFGREGLDLATIWDPFLSWVPLTEEEYSERPLMQAFRMYRNYDGNGGRFGDTSLFASSSDESTISVFAAERSNDGAVTVMLVNKATAPQSIAVDSMRIEGTAERYEYGVADATSIVRIDDLVIAGDADTTLDLPARSATLLVIDPASGTEPTEPTEPAGPTEPIVLPSGLTVAFPSVSGDADWVGVRRDPVDTPSVRLVDQPRLTTAQLEFDRFYPGEIVGDETADRITVYTDCAR